MKVSTQVHGDRAYADKIREFARETGKEVSTVLRQEGRLMSVSLATETQPHGNDEKARDLGRSAVQRDISRLFATPSEAYGAILSQDGEPLAKEFNALVSRGKTLDAQHLLSDQSTSKLRGLPIASAPDTALHSANRTTKGRGRNKVVQIVTSAAARKRFITAKQRLVGFAKSGWATCARLLGGTRGIPGWVSRNKGPGSVSDNSRATSNPGVTLKNSVSYIDKVLRPEGIENAFRIGRSRLRRMINIALTKARAKARLHR